MRKSLCLKGFAIPASLVLAVVLSACVGRTVYDKFHHTPLSGWEKNDTLTFDVEPIQGGLETTPSLYREELGLRISQDYPFTSLQLIVEQTFLPTSTPNTKHPTPIKPRLVRRDTLNCRLIDDDGNVRGQGVSTYQYKFHITDMQIQKGDSLHITVRHNMKREILPGIADVGIKITRR
ncbi:MAG: gliding motility lipoprotein GldH [Prevotella sp.]|nr:gliding motility lipoprotein GldH [Prevotella sp.]